MSKELTIKVKTVGTPVAESIKYRLIDDQMVNLTRTKAFEILEYDTFSAERPVREYHVQSLYNEWLAGRFLWHQAMVAHGIIYEHGPSGTKIPRLYRLNGQHTCWMRVNIPKEKDPAVCKVRQLIYECQDMDGLREIYSVIDRNASRSNAHITKVLLSEASSCTGIPISYLNCLMAGFKLWQWETAWDRKFKGNPQELAAMVQGKYSNLFRVVGQYFQQRYAEWSQIRRSGIVAALYATFEKAPNNAPDFWSQVCNGLNFTSKTDPRYQLRTFCEEHGMNVAYGKMAIGAEEIYRISINMWNKWRRNEQVSVARSTDERVRAI